LNGSRADDDKRPERWRQRNEKTDRSQSLILLVASNFKKVKWFVPLVPLVENESFDVKSQEWTGGWSRFMGYQVRSHRAVQDIVLPHRTFP